MAGTSERLLDQAFGATSTARGSREPIPRSGPLDPQLLPPAVRTRLGLPPMSAASLQLLGLRPYPDDVLERCNDDQLRALGLRPNDR